MKIKNPQHEIDMEHASSHNSPVRITCLGDLEKYTSPAFVRKLIATAKKGDDTWIYDLVQDLGNGIKPTSPTWIREFHKRLVDKGIGAEDIEVLPIYEAICRAAGLTILPTTGEPFRAESETNNTETPYTQEEYEAMRDGIADQLNIPINPLRPDPII